MTEQDPPVDALPIEIGGHKYLFRLEDGDVIEIERTLSVFEAFHPSRRTYMNAALFLQHGLRKRGKDGALVYIFQQDEVGHKDAFQYVKKFCSQFPGSMGMVVLYGYYQKALVALEWLGEQRGEPAGEKKPEEPEQAKNSVPPTSGQTSTLRSVFAGLLRKSSED